MLDERKKQLFASLVAEHVSSAAPVGSKLLAEKSDIQISSATIRNDLAELEQAGFISHPHTSAGRIPTAKGWQYYIDELMQEQAPSKKASEKLEKIAHDKKLETNDVLKSVARTLAELSQNASIMAFSQNDIYYTGLSNLFAKPEFDELELVRNMSEVIDHMDDVVEKLFAKLDVGTHVLVGADNPFGQDCGVIISKVSHKGADRLMGVLGPVRMHYDTNFGLMKHTATLLTN